MDILKTRADIAGLSVFSALKKHPLIQSLDILLESVFAEADPLDLIRGWADFAGNLALLAQQDSFNSFYSLISFLTITDDNAFTRKLESQSYASRTTGSMDLDQISPALCALAKNDLSRLGRLAGFDLPGLGAHLAELLNKAGLGESASSIIKEAQVLSSNAAEGGSGFNVPAELFPRNADWGEALSKLGEYIRTHGAGELGLYSSFSWSGASLRPVLNPDPIRLTDLSGYEDQRSIVTANTLRFLEGKIANNLLLYGDRGTGKSATVKAVCNEYTERGLRLIEVRKERLPELSAILDILSSRSLRFIVFIDDLSFESTDDSFTSLKGLLEGGIESRPDNVVVYATSNRRHLVKERLSDRPSSAEAANAASTGDVRAFDTMQEQFSLADRFGITVVYTAPNQDEYLRIACFIGQQRGILNGAGEEEQQRFRDNALRWERWFNGRSPRTAVQYVEWVAGGAGFPWES
ncbi:ATP-binding protein [Treponema primitia]|uniref:ATP-binding protein n=1 Tax=Treponema primitia TaxID=88058 RepID=UPI000255537C|nr:ATP-binding protein [Treponema primitia]